MLAFLTEIIPLVIMIYKEFYSSKAQSEADNKAFVLDQLKWKEIVDNAVDAWNDSNTDRTQESVNAWDAADADARSTLDHPESETPKEPK